MSSLNLQTDRGSDLRRLQDRIAGLRDQEAPTDRENRLVAERAQQAQQAATTEALYQTNTAALRDEDMERTKQHKRATKLIEKINKHTKKLTKALPEAKGGEGEVGKLSHNYNKAMKTMSYFIKDYTESNPTHNSNWHTLLPKRQRALTHFHQSLSSNAQHHRAISQFNTAKKHAEEFAAEANVANFRGKMSPGNQQNLDGWLQHLDIPVVDPLVSTPVVAPVISSSAKTDTGGRKTRKRKRKRRRKTRKRRKKKKTRRKRKKRHRKTRKK
jgi:vacuolar-type H+-ATPase subunit I/STV1